MKFYKGQKIKLKPGYFFDYKNPTPEIILFVGDVDSRGAITTVISPENIGWKIDSRRNLRRLGREHLGWYAWNVGGRERFEGVIKNICIECQHNCRSNDPELKECPFFEKE
jgi:hypothetical protein